MQHSTIRALLLGLVATVVFFGNAAEGGSTLLARDSTIRATGRAGSTDYNLLEESQAFSGFSDAVSTSDLGVAGGNVAANQHSQPSLRDNDFVGAYAEGSASAMANSEDVATAVSHFELTFQISGAPSLAAFGGSAGVTGSGTTAVSLVNQTTGESMFEQEIDDANAEGRTLDYSGALNPGVYALSVDATANGDLDGSMAFYTVSLTITPGAGGGGTTPIPLPPMLWAAACLMGTAVGAQRLTRFQSRIC